ncbi:MAG: MBL fold metallo-hydrolase [Phenylobacterium sp.]|nr:MBL fold metallo-hydrolase [Phenylobacterium sp.]MBP8246107.1 MBL fold metallo-hydrolase [Phenylobacterium sp.]
MPSRPASPILAALFASAFLTACAAPASQAAPPPLPPTANPPAGMTIGVVPSGSTQSSAGQAFEGGRGGDRRTFVAGAILVDHPKGKLLFDAGYGRDLAQHFKTAPALMQAIIKPQLTTPVAEQLAASGIAPASLKSVVLTHAHWDHVSGLEHFPKTPVWVSKAELDFVKGGDRSAELARRLGVANYRTFGFPDGPYLGFATSWNVFGDGSVVLVPSPGHTPGSIAAFVNTPDGKRYVLVGDTAWQTEGVDLPAQKPILARSLVDHDAPGTWAALQRLHAAKQALPDLIVVPAHDDRVWKTLPALRPVPAKGAKTEAPPPAV